MPSKMLERLRCEMSLGGLSLREASRRTLSKASENEIPTRAAAIAYYSFSALVPFLAVVVTLALVLLPELPIQGPSGSGDLSHQIMDQFRTQLERLLPRDAFLIVANQIARLQKEPPVGLISIGLLVSLYLASGVFSGVMDAINHIQGLTETRPIWKRYGIALLMTIVEAAVLLSSLAVIVLWPQLTSWLGLRSSTAVVVASVVQWLVVGLTLLLSFAIAFHAAPSVRPRWEWITPGSLLGTVLFILVSLMFRIYIQLFATSSRTYGSLGGVIILLMWIWITSMIVLAAAQLNVVAREACGPDDRSSRQPARDSHSGNQTDGPVVPGAIPHVSQS